MVVAHCAHEPANADSKYAAGCTRPACSPSRAHSNGRVISRVWFYLASLMPPNMRSERWPLSPPAQQVLFHALRTAAQHLSRKTLIPLQVLCRMLFIIRCSALSVRCAMLLFLNSCSAFSKHLQNTWSVIISTTAPGRFLSRQKLSLQFSRTRWRSPLYQGALIEHFAP